jgi:hypothetical protein
LNTPPSTDHGGRRRVATHVQPIATKEEVILAVTADLIKATAAQLGRQRRELSELETLRAPHLDMISATAAGPPAAIITERMITTARVVASSPALRLAAGDYRRRAMTAALATTWGSVPRTAGCGWRLRRGRRSCC